MTARSPARKKLTPKPRRMWGLFNYNTFYEAGRTRAACRYHAERDIGKDFEKYFRNGSMQIRKITITEGWK